MLIETSIGPRTTVRSDRHPRLAGLGSAARARHRRPEMLDRRPAWGGEWGHTSAMRLEPLRRRYGPPPRRVARGGIPGHPGPRHGTGRGQPFFVEELVGTLIDRESGADDGTWSFRELPTGFTVPDSVQAVLAADRPPACRREGGANGRRHRAHVLDRPVYELVSGESPDIGLLEGGLRASPSRSAWRANVSM
jgi:hypothetical protein